MAQSKLSRKAYSTKDGVDPPLAERVREAYRHRKHEQVGLKEPIHPDYLYSVDEVADVIGISERTLRRWLADGYGPRFRRLKGNMLRVRGAAVLDFIDNPPELA